MAEAKLRKSERDRRAALEAEAKKASETAAADPEQAAKAAITNRRESWGPAEHLAVRERELAQLQPQFDAKVFGADKRMAVLKAEIAEYQEQLKAATVEALSTELAAAESTAEPAAEETKPKRK